MHNAADEHPRWAENLRRRTAHHTIVRRCESLQYSQGTRALGTAPRRKAPESLRSRAVDACAQLSAIGNRYQSANHHPERAGRTKKNKKKGTRKQKHKIKIKSETNPQKDSVQLAQLVRIIRAYHTSSSDGTGPAWVGDGAADELWLLLPGALPPPLKWPAC